MQEMTKDEQIAVMQAKIDEMTSAIALIAPETGLFSILHIRRQTILENKNKAPNALIFGVGACNI